MTERVIPVRAKMKILEKDKKKDQGTCVRKRNAFSLLHDSPFNDDSISNYLIRLEINLQCNKTIPCNLSY